MTLNVISFDEGWMGISGLISLLLEFSWYYFS